MDFSQADQMDFSQAIPKSLSEKIKLFNIGKTPVYVKDFVTAAVCGGMYWAMSNYVSSVLMIPYIIFAAATTFYFIRPAKKTNPGKRNWEVILLLFTHRQGVFYSLSHKEEGYV